MDGKKFVFAPNSKIKIEKKVISPTVLTKERITFVFTCTYMIFCGFLLVE